jgi:capsule polysaccharide modification protein KpsS
MKKNILFYPSHSPKQFIEIARQCVAENPEINPIFFLLDNSEATSEFDYISYEQVVNHCNFDGEDDNDSIYGFNLNEAALADRLHKKNIDVKPILQKFRRGFRQFLIEKDIDMIFSYAMSDSIGYAAFMTSKSMQIPFFYFCSTRVEDFYYLTSQLNGSAENADMHNHKRPFLNFEYSDALQLLKEKVEHHSVPSYALDLTMMAHKPLFKRAHSFANLILANLKSKNKYLQLYIPIKESIFNALKRSKSIKELNKHIQNFEQISKNKFLFYPLHLHPENSTLMWGRWCYNQIELLKLISRVLPSDVYLYVKEHKVAEGRHELGFYDQIAALPNVVFVPSNTNPHELIKKSLAVVTISGTVGFEAICHAKNVLVFGDADYVNFPNAISCTNLKNFRENVHLAISSKTKVLDENEAFVNFVLNKLRLSLKLPNYSPYSLDNSIIEPIKNLFLNQIN